MAADATQPEPSADDEAAWGTGRRLAEHRSRVLSGAPSNVPIAPETRDRVLKAAADLGYTPNPLARALRSARTGLIGLIVRDINDPFFAMAVAAITAEAAC